MFLLYLAHSAEISSNIAMGGLLFEKSRCRVDDPALTATNRQLHDCSDACYQVVQLELTFAESKSAALGLCLQNEARLKILREHEKVAPPFQQKKSNFACMRQRAWNDW